MYQRIRFFLGTSLLLNVLMVVTVLGTLVLSLSSNPPVFFLMYIVPPLFLVACVADLVVTGRFLSVLNKFEKGQGDPSEELETVDSHIKRWRVTSWVWSISAVVLNLTYAVNHFMQGDIGSGLFSLLAAVLIAILSNNNHKGTRDTVKRLLGEKSKALRDKLVQAQEGFKGGPIPQGT